MSLLNNSMYHINMHEEKSPSLFRTQYTWCAIQIDLMKLNCYFTGHERQDEKNRIKELLRMDITLQLIILSTM